MPGLPFSGKQKKAQLQAKRQRKAEKIARLESAEAGDKPEDSHGSNAEADAPGADGAPADGHGKVTEHEGCTTRGGAAYKNDKRSLFRKETREEVDRRTRAAQQEYTWRDFNKGVPFSNWWHTTDEPAHGEDGAFSRIPRSVEIPRRPSWEALETQAVDAREKAYFRAYMRKVDMLYGHMQTNFFERNLEVWRQLWRVVEASDVVAVVVDARHPLFHLPLSLLDYLKAAGKPCLVIINKIDLIPADVLEQWLEYFKACAPGLAVFPFTCSPNEESVTLDIDEKQYRKKRLRNTNRIIAYLAEAKKRADENGDRGFDAAALERQLLEADDASSATGTNTDQEMGKCERRRRLRSPSRNPCGMVSDDLKSLGFSSGCEQTTTKDEESRPQRQGHRKCGSRRHARLRTEDADGQGGGQSSSDEEEGKEDSGACTDEPPMETFLGERKNAREETKSQRNHAEVAAVAAKVAELKEIVLAMGRAKGLQKVTLGTVGHPNVGKSSLINILKGEKVVSTSYTAGHTKHLQHILLDDDIMLVDCPGLSFPTTGLPLFVQVLMGSYSLAQNREPYSAVHYLGERLPLERIYHLQPPRSTDIGWCGWTVCEAFAEKNGMFLRRGKGLPDAYRAGQKILKEFVTGVLVLYFLPPPVDQRQQAPLPLPVNEADIMSELQAVYSQSEGDTDEQTHDQMSSDSASITPTPAHSRRKGRRKGPKRNVRADGGGGGGGGGGASGAVRGGGSSSKPAMRISVSPPRDAQRDGSADELGGAAADALFEKLQGAGASHSSRKQQAEQQRCAKQRKGRRAAKQKYEDDPPPKNGPSKS
ncbi:Large subunit GTPase 1-like protein [Diplonema papillatum]|nr:Large subunit GTPase 1-like protein [Diplonema papillatum]